jgi:hypothetical protein
MAISEERASAERECRQLQARVAELEEAARAFEASLSEYCDGPERDALRAALARPETREGVRR